MQGFAAYFIAWVIVIMLYIGIAIVLKGTYGAYKEHNKVKEEKKKQRRK